MGELEPTPIPVEVGLIHTNVNCFFYASLEPPLLPVQNLNRIHGHSVARAIFVEMAGYFRLFS